MTAWDATSGKVAVVAYDLYGAAAPAGGAVDFFAVVDDPLGAFGARLVRTRQTVAVPHWAQWVGVVR